MAYKITDACVLEAMTPYFTEYYGNPSAFYSFSSTAGKAVAEARENIANLIGAKKEEIYFTGGGSESDNWALKATAEAYGNKGKHIISDFCLYLSHLARYFSPMGFF